MGKTKSKGAKDYKVTEEDTILVKRLSRVGETQDMIARVLGISKDTLYKYYSDHLEVGRALALLPIKEKAYQKALEGDNTMICFVLKTQGGWRETDNYSTLAGNQNYVFQFADIKSSDDDGDILIEH